MTQARRAALLLGLALVLGTLAASDVARREAALTERLGPSIARVVAARDLPGGHTLRPRDLAVRRVPERYAPLEAVGDPAELVGQTLAAGAMRGAYLGAAHLRVPGGAPVGPGERAVDIVALASSDLVVTGVRVDVLVTRERGDGGGPAGAELALQDVEVLDAAAAEADDGRSRVAATLRVTVRQAVFLAAAQAFARDVRLLPRAAGDRRRSQALAVGEELR